MVIIKVIFKMLFFPFLFQGPKKKSYKIWLLKKKKKDQYTFATIYSIFFLVLFKCYQ